MTSAEYKKMLFRKMRESEHQKRVMIEARSRVRDDPRWGLLYHIPNQSNLPSRIAAMAGKLMLSMGMMPGAPDLHLPVARWASVDDFRVFCPSLYIEMKKPGGSLSDKQKECHADLEMAGNLVITCYDYEEAIERIDAYLKGRLREITEDHPTFEPCNLQDHD